MNYGGFPLRQETRFIKANIVRKRHNSQAGAGPDNPSGYLEKQPSGITGSMS